MVWPVRRRCFLIFKQMYSRACRTCSTGQVSTYNNVVENPPPDHAVSAHAQARGDAERFTRRSSRRMEGDGLQPEP